MLKNIFPFVLITFLLISCSPKNNICNYRNLRRDINPTVCYHCFMKGKNERQVDISIGSDKSNILMQKSGRNTAIETSSLQKEQTESSTAKIVMNKKAVPVLKSFIHHSFVRSIPTNIQSS